MNAVPSISDFLGGSDEPFVISDYGAVRVVIINRPSARNALTRDMRRSFAEIFRSADGNPAISAIVLTGADPAFCAGVDLKERGAGAPPPPVRPCPGEVLRAARTPVIAAVNGPCATGALEMALSCAFVIASERARFGDTHAKLGLFPSWGQSALLPRAIGIRRARQLMLSGEFIDARAAYDWGIANEIVAHDDLLARAIAIGAMIADACPISVELILGALDETECRFTDPALAVEDRARERWEAWSAKRYDSAASRANEEGDR